MQTIAKSIIGSIAGIYSAAASLHDVRLAIEAASIWEWRQARWNEKWSDCKDDYSELYRKLIDIVLCFGFTDLSNVQLMVLSDTPQERLSLKKVAEQLVGHKLPDINPKYCIEWTKELPLSAENIYNGLTDIF